MEEKRLGVILQRVQNALARSMDCHARTLGLTGGQLSIIDFIKTHEDKQDLPIYQKDIEAEFNIRKATATNILKLMEKKNLITRVAHQNDARLKEIHLTPLAQELALHIQEILSTAEKSMTNLLGENDKTKLIAMLNNIEKTFSY